MLNNSTSTRGRFFFFLSLGPVAGQWLPELVPVQDVVSCWILQLQPKQHTTRSAFAAASSCVCFPWFRTCAHLQACTYDSLRFFSSVQPSKFFYCAFTGVSGLDFWKRVATASVSTLLCFFLRVWQNDSTRSKRLAFCFVSATRLSHCVAS